MSILLSTVLSLALDRVGVYPLMRLSLSPSLFSSPRFVPHALIGYEIRSNRAATCLRHLVRCVSERRRGEIQWRGSFLRERTVTRFLSLLTVKRPTLVLSPPLSLCPSLSFFFSHSSFNNKPYQCDSSVSLVSFLACVSYVRASVRPSVRSADVRARSDVISRARCHFTRRMHAHAASMHVRTHVRPTGKERERDLAMSDRAVSSAWIFIGLSRNYC